MGRRPDHARRPAGEKGVTGPRLTQYRTMLAVADLRRTQEFYKRLGFKVVGEFANPEPVWTELVRDGVALMFNAPPRKDVEAQPRRAKDFQIYYFNSDDVAGLQAEWKRAGIAVTDL